MTTTKMHCLELNSLPAFAAPQEAVTGRVWTEKIECHQQAISYYKTLSTYW